jgi:Uma2 family endonuclease
MAKVVRGRTLLTYSDYVKIPEDGQRHEIIEGRHYVTPSPITRHQRISRHTQFQLYEQIELPGHGEVFDAPTDVVLSDSDIVVPDIFVILAANASIIGEKNVRGAPDLAVEITSPSTKKRDQQLKRRLYEKHGVPEYWVVLVDEDAVEKLVLSGGAYESRGRFADRITFDGLEGVSVDLTRVW